MSFYDYKRSQELEKADEPFYGLIMAAMRKADTDNAERLRQAFPDVWEELNVRYHAPGGILLSDGETRIIANAETSEP